MPIYRVTISGIYLGQLNQNVMNFKDDGAGTPTETGLMTDLRDNWVENIRFLQNQGYQYTIMTAQEMLPLQRAPVQLSINTKVGTLAGTGEHPSIAGLFTFRTLNPTRKGRGRYYMGGVHQASVANGVVQSGALGQYVATAAILTTRYADAGSGPYALVVGPRTYVNSADYLPVQAIIARSYFGIQRKRNISVGA
jgi:hypothetical protein